MCRIIITFIDIYINIYIYVCTHAPELYMGIPGDSGEENQRSRG